MCDVYPQTSSEMVIIISYLLFLNKCSLICIDVVPQTSSEVIIIIVLSIKKMFYNI